MKIVEIEATNRCNTHCLHCPREAISRGLGTMTWDTYRIVVDKALSVPGYQAVYFSGMGEPTLNPLLSRFIAHISDRVPTAVTTNGSVLDSAGIADLIGAGLSQVIVSYTGHTPELYRLMSGGLDLERVDACIRELVQQGKGRLRVSANVSVTRQNREHLAEIRAHLEKLGVDDIVFALCHNRGGYLDDPQVCDTPPPPADIGRCDIFAETLFVAWNGLVLACCHDLEGAGQVGDLVQEDITVIKARRRMIAEAGVRFKMCARCNDMYRFGSDETPDKGPLSEWVYRLYDGLQGAEARLVDVIWAQQRRIQELEAAVAGYERGRFIRFSRWLHQTWRRISGQGR